MKKLSIILLIFLSFGCTRLNQNCIYHKIEVITEKQCILSSGIEKDILGEKIRVCILFFEGTKSECETMYPKHREILKKRFSETMNFKDLEIIKESEA